MRSITSAGSSSPSQPAPMTAPTRGVVMKCGRGQHHGVAQRAREPGLVAMGEDVTADVDEDDGVAPQCGRGGVERRGDRARAAVGVHEQHRLARHAGEVGLGEAEAARPGRLRAGHDRAVDERLAVLDLVQVPRPGQRVDRPPLPGDAADAASPGQRDWATA